MMNFLRGGEGANKAEGVDAKDISIAIDSKPPEDTFLNDYVLGGECY